MMRLLVLGIALLFLPDCIAASPVAKEEKSSEEQLRESIGPFCDDICQRGLACDIDIAEDCPDECREYMGAFVDHGAECVAFGHDMENCINSLRTCEELGGVEDCDAQGRAHEQCVQGKEPGNSGGPVYCDNYGYGRGSAPTGAAGTAGSAGTAGTTGTGSEPMTESCDLFFDHCTDGSEYRVSCDAIDDTLVCNCFKDGIVNGVAFTPEDDCAATTEVNAPCGWSLAE